VGNPLDAAVTRVASLIAAAMAGPGPATPLLERLADCEPGEIRIRTLRYGRARLGARDAAVLDASPGDWCWWRDGVMELPERTALARTFIALRPGGPVTDQVLAELEAGTPAGTALPGLERGYQSALNVTGHPGKHGVAAESRALLLLPGMGIRGYASEVFPVTACAWLACKLDASVLALAGKLGWPRRRGNAVDPGPDRNRGAAYVHSTSRASLMPAGGSRPCGDGCACGRHVKPKGAASPNWIGDRITHKAMHTRVIRVRGPARAHRCLFCAERGAEKQAYDWAQIHETPGLDIADYIALCRRCHLRYDKDAGARNKPTENRKAAARRRRHLARGHDPLTGRFTSYLPDPVIR
jgi:hypothetical protein